MKKIDPAEFWKRIGSLNCHPQHAGKYPYTSVFKTPDGREVGRIVPVITEEPAYPIPEEYFVP